MGIFTRPLLFILIEYMDDIDPGEIWNMEIKKPYFLLKLKLGGM